MRASSVGLRDKKWFITESGKGSLRRRLAALRFSDLQVDSRMGLNGRMAADDCGTASMGERRHHARPCFAVHNHHAVTPSPTYLVVSAASETPPCGSPRPRE